jgi:hypothetical protein
MLDDRDVCAAIRLTHLNPQTQEFTIDDRRRGATTDCDPACTQHEGRPGGRPSFGC